MFDSLEKRFSLILKSAYRLRPRRRHGSEGTQPPEAVEVFGVGSTHYRTLFDYEVADYESTAYGPGIRSFMSVRRARMLQVVDSLSLPARARVLDAGCGPGLFLESLASRGLQLFGLDASPAMLRRASERLRACRAHLQLGNIERLPYRDASFDVVCSAGVLEYLEQDTKVLMEMRRVLRPGGHLILSATNFWSPAYCLVPLLEFLKRRPWVLATCNAIWQALGHPPVRARHFRIRHHRPAQLRGALVQAGFVLDEEAYFYMSLWPEPLDRLLPRPTAAVERQLMPLTRSRLGRLAAGYLTVSSRPTRPGPERTRFDSRMETAAS